MKSGLVAVLMIAGALCAGCSKEEPKKEEQKPAPAQAQSALPAVCDEYFKKADECFSKNAQLKAQMETSIKQVKEMLTARAANPGEKEKIASECQEKINLLALSCK